MGNKNKDKNKGWVHMRIITSKDDKMTFGIHWAAGVYPSAFKKVNI